MLAGVLTARSFGLNDDAGFVFTVGYLVLSFGILIGVVQCREHS
jgi:hypothetical protein